MLGGGAPRPPGCASDLDLRTDNQAITWLKTNEHLNKMHVRWLDEIEDFRHLNKMNKNRLLNKTHVRWLDDST